jgi:hypothetical protein
VEVAERAAAVVAELVAAGLVEESAEKEGPGRVPVDYSPEQRHCLNSQMTETTPRPP